MPKVTPADLAAWRGDIAEHGALYPAQAQRIAPLLMDELERAWEELARARAELAARSAAPPEKGQG